MVSGIANQTVSFKFTPDSPWLPWQQHLEQMGYNSASARDICEIFASIGGLTSVLILRDIFCAYKSEAEIKTWYSVDMR